MFMMSFISHGQYDNNINSKITDCNLVILSGLLNTDEPVTSASYNKIIKHQLCRSDNKQLVWNALTKGQIIASKENLEKGKEGSSEKSAEELTAEWKKSDFHEWRQQFCFDKEGNRKEEISAHIVAEQINPALLGAYNHCVAGKTKQSATVTVTLKDNEKRGVIYINNVNQFGGGKTKLTWMDLEGVWIPIDGKCKNDIEENRFEGFGGWSDTDELKNTTVYKYLTQWFKKDENNPDELQGLQIPVCFETDNSFKNKEKRPHNIDLSYRTQYTGAGGGTYKIGFWTNNPDYKPQKKEE